MEEQSNDRWHLFHNYEEEQKTAEELKILEQEHESKKIIVLAKNLKFGDHIWIESFGLWFQLMDKKEPNSEGKIRVSLSYLISKKHYNWWTYGANEEIVVKKRKYPL